MVYEYSATAIGGTDKHLQSLKCRYKRFNKKINMSSKSNDQGRAYEYICLHSLNDATGSIDTIFAKCA